MTHVSKIESLVHQLHDMGTILGEDQLTTKVLMTLPVKYSNFREAWALLPSIEQTREKMIAKLLLAESMYAHRESQEQSGRDIALLASTQRRRFNVGDHPKKVCSFCGYSNHTFANCRKRKRDHGDLQQDNSNQRTSSNRKPRVQCTYCGYANYVVAVCRKRIREKKEKSSSDSTAANTTISDKQSTDASSITFTYPTLANTSLLSLISFVNWCAESGATRHMTDNREYFTKFVPVTHVWTVKGVGSDHKQLQVKGWGDIIIRSTKSTNMPDGILSDVLYVPGLGASYSQSVRQLILESLLFLLTRTFISIATTNLS